jgi:hypothetical protein
MNFARRHFKLLTVGAACVAVGAGASAIATAGAAGTSTAMSSAAATTSSTAAKSYSTVRHPAARRALERRAVQGDLVVATKNGFATVTFNRGFVQSVNGQQLTIREGTKKAMYKTVTMTIPAGAKVRDNGETTSLSQLSAGQRVAVVQAPKRTWVIARDARP